MTDEYRQARVDELCKDIKLSDKECLAELKILINDKKNEVVLEPRYEEIKRELYALNRVADMLEIKIKAKENAERSL